MQDDWSIYAALPIPYYEVNTDGAIVWANTSAEHVFGIQLAELKGTKIWDLVSKSGRKESEDRVRAKLSGHRAPDRGLKVTFCHFSTRLRLFEIYDGLLYCKAGNITGIRTFLRDLNIPTELLAELRSLGSTWFAQLENIADLFVLRKDEFGRITHANQNLLQEMSQNPKPPIGMTDSDLFPVQLAEKYESDDVRLLRYSGVRHTGGDDDIFQDVEWFSGDGKLESKRQIQVVKSVIRDESTGTLGIQIVFWYLEKSEVVARRLTETIAKGKASTLDFLRESSIGFYRCYDDGKFQFVNQGFARILNYESADDLSRLNMGRDIYFNPEERAKNTKDLKAMGVFHARHMQFRTATGGPIWVSVSARLVREGRDLVFEGIILSYAKEREQQRHAEQVARLQAAKFLAGDAAHELSNGLMGCLGSIETALYILERGSLPVGQRNELSRHLNAVYDYINRSTGVLGDLSDIESRKNDEVETFSIESVITEITNEILKSVVKNDVAIICTGHDVEFVGSKHILVRVLRNLIDNAVDAARAGGREPRVEVKWTEERTTWPSIMGAPMAVAKDLVIRIRDNGRGISRVDMDKVWNRGVSHKRGHLGIGLYLTRMFVTSLLGGQVELKNNDDGCGCVAILTLRM